MLLLLLLLDFYISKAEKNPHKKHNNIRTEIPSLPTFDPRSKYAYKNSKMFICHGMLTVFTDIPKRHNIETTEEIRLRIETRVLFKNEPNTIKKQIAA